MNPSKNDVELEAALLKSLAIKANYDKFYSTLDTKKLIPVTDRLLKNYKTYYDKYNEDIDWAVFYTEFTQNMSKDLDKDDIVYYRETVFPLIRNSEIGNHVYTSLLEREASHKLEQILANGFCVEKAQEVIAGLKSQLQMYQKDNDREIFKRMTDVDLTELHSEGGVTWCLPSLQAGLGSLRGGNFTLLSGDSNSGKSKLAISQTAHTIQLKTGKPVLYFDSEHTDQELRARVLSNLYRDKVLEGFEGISLQQEKIYKHFDNEYGHESFISYQLRSPNDYRMIEKAIEKFDPCLVVIDMVDRMSTSLAIQDLTVLYDNVRSLSNTGYPIIGTTQAGDTSYMGKDGKIRHHKWLSEKHTQGSKGGGKQGAAYCMIMIGIDDDMPNIRYLNTTKKKRGKNVAVTCMIEEKYSLYKELL